jgi:hypothetical protein
VRRKRQIRYRATRAAQVVAQRDLLEFPKGLNLIRSISDKDGILQSDEIKTSADGFLRGVLMCGKMYDSTKGCAEVCMRVGLYKGRPV